MMEERKRTVADLVAVLLAARRDEATWAMRAGAVSDEYLQHVRPDVAAAWEASRTRLSAAEAALTSAGVTREEYLAARSEI